MALPTKDQISNALENGGNILDPELSGYDTIDGVIGPECYSGGFCLVYPVTNGTNKYAFRVWHTEIDGIKERMKKISAYLASHPLPYFVEFDYVDNALRVIDEDGNEQRIDAVRMEWVNGKNLVSYIDSVVLGLGKTDSEKKQCLLHLASQFKEMVSHLHSVNIAHGDLQHGNIIITPENEIRLVDYDSLYVPTFTDEEQVTYGMAAYQHPSRKNNTFKASHSDDYFSEQIIYLSLLCFAEDLSLWEPLEERDEYSLLFTEADLNSITSSQLYKRVSQFKNSEIRQLLTELKQNLSYSDTSNIKPLENALRNNYEEAPLGMQMDSDLITDLIGPQKPKATYKKQVIDIPDFDEAAAQARYSQN
ncbi:MAG: protein kinase family protein [Prevotella sp.]|nr:protein kinase family protein [Prevotella sp.]